jgi:hypothetical protein
MFGCFRFQISYSQQALDRDAVAIILAYVLGTSMFERLLMSHLNTAGTHHGDAVTHARASDSLGGGFTDIDCRAVSIRHGNREFESVTQPAKPPIATHWTGAPDYPVGLIV